MRNTNTTPGLWGARNAFALLGASGNKSVSGYAYLNGSPAIRRITIMTQPPKAVVVYETTTNIVAGTFSFPRLPAGNYMVIDSMLDNSRQALVYDWVVAA